MKKLLSVILAVGALLPFINNINSKAFNFPMTTQLVSESAMVINLDSDIIIHEKNADMKQMPGPLVNIMTAVICLENCQNLKEEITMDSSVYASFEQSEYYNDIIYGDIYDGDVLSVEDLLYAMMLTSSIEASQTLATHFGGGSTSAFVELMNKKAAEIGCTATNFTNACGMYDTQQYTTARDMAIITKYALKVPRFEEIATTVSYTPSHPNTERHPSDSEDPWVWNHSNLMTDSNSQYYYNGAKGIKTGNLESAGRNIVTMASKNGNNYLAVLMKSPLRDNAGERQFYHIEDAEAVFNWAFNHFSYQVLLSDSIEVDEIEVELGDNSDYVLVKPEKEFSYLWYDGIDTALIKPETNCPDVITAPVKKGQKLGEVELKYSGESIGKVTLVAVSDVDRSVSKYNLYAAKKFISSQWFKKAIMISSVLCGIYILLCIYAFVCYKNNQKPIKPIYTMPKVTNNSKKKKNK